MKKEPFWAEILQEGLFVTFAILNIDVSNKNDWKLDKILQDFLQSIFWKA